jgi:hypothetical protein
MGFTGFSRCVTFRLTGNIAGEPRGCGGLQPVACPWGMRQPVEGVRPLRTTFFLAPLLALFHSGCPREREAGVRRSWLRPMANANAPTSLSSLLLLGLHRIGGSTDVPLRRGGSWRAREAPAHHPSRQTYGPGAKGDGPITPSEPEPSPAATLPPSTGAAYGYRLTHGRNFQTARSGRRNRRSVTRGAWRGLQRPAAPRPSGETRRPLF